MDTKLKYDSGLEFYNQGDYEKTFDILNDLYRNINQIRENDLLEKQEICKFLLILSELLSKTDKNASIRLLEELISFYDDFIPAIINLSDFYRLTGKINKAISLLIKAETLNPNLWQVYTNLCECYISLFRFDDASKAINKANILNPNSAFIQKKMSKFNNKFESEYLELSKKLSSLLSDDKNIHDNGSYSNEIIILLQKIGTNLISQGKILEGINHLKAGPGYIKINAATPPDNLNDIIINKLDVVQAPHFIGSWLLNDLKICDEMISYFDNNKDSQVDGKMTGELEKKKKNSKDISFSPKGVLENKNVFFSNYFKHLHTCFFDYCSRWPYLRDGLKDFHVGIFNIQKYSSGGHFINPHAERNIMATQHRFFAFMTYLNDVTDGGETVFPHFDLKVKPKKGHTLIWPSDWTHVHYGDLVSSTDKYIITGWIEKH